MIPQRKAEAPSFLAPSAAPSARNAPAPRPSPRLYSIAALLRAGRFEGRFEARQGSFRFSYSPVSAAIVRRRLELTGTFTVGSDTGPARTAAAIRARLLGTQGSVADAPPRSRPSAARPSGAPVAGEDRPGAATSTASRASRGLPITESTGPDGSAGVLYFELSPLDARALGVGVDMTRVQLNARLSPDNDRDRTLFWIYADLVAATHGGSKSRVAGPLRRLLLALKG